MTYQVNEIFQSVQGEGYHTGVPATFIRLQGCTVGCVWCDTKYTWAAGGSKMDVISILAQVQHHHVVITGGEPLAYDLDELLIALKGRFVQVETSGQHMLRGRLKPTWMTWSPKPRLQWSAPEPFKWLVDEIKFVVDDVLTEDVINKVYGWFDSAHRMGVQVVLMPEGCPPTEASMKRAFDLVMANPSWRFSDRLQYRLGVK